MTQDIVILKNSRLCNMEKKKFDKYGNPIPKHGQGWGVDDDPEYRNRQGYNEDGSKGPWFSRSCAVCTMVYTFDRDSYYVLANKRGAGALDYKGYWNMPCGYLDYNETAEEAAVREVFEETGIKVDPRDLAFESFSTDPKQNRQNVVFYYSAFIDSESQKFSKAHMEENEVEDIAWISIHDIDYFMWAFDHDEIIKNKFKRFIKND